MREVPASGWPLIINDWLGPYVRVHVYHRLWSKAFLERVPVSTKSVVLEMLFAVYSKYTFLTPLAFD